MRPLIGITTNREQTCWQRGTRPVLLPSSYADAVAAAGREPALLPTGSVTAGAVDRIDGLVRASPASTGPTVRR